MTEGRVADDEPVLAHVEVMGSQYQGHQGINVHQSLQMITRYHQTEHSRSHHCSGDDPERDGDTIAGVQEAMIVHHCTKEEAHEASQAYTKCCAETSCMNAFTLHLEHDHKTDIQESIRPRNKTSVDTGIVMWRAMDCVRLDTGPKEI